MFGWFKKREPEPAAASEPRDWMNMKAEMSGRPVFIRLRASLRDPAVQRDYGHEICTRITFHARRSGKTLELTFIQVRNGLGQPRFPELEAKAKALGYRGSGAMFADVER